MPISLFVWLRSFIEPDLFDNNVPFVVRQWHSDLSDRSALEIRVKIRVRLKVAVFFAFFTENKESEHLILREFHGR